MIRTDENCKKLISILDKYIFPKKSRILKNPENPTRFLLCWVNLTNTFFDHFEVYLYDKMGIFL